MKRAIAGLALLLSCVFAAAGQTTAFNYQGSLNTSGTPANGNHDFEFALFDSLAAGVQLGSTLNRSNVAVTNGTFAVSLDFGNQFQGANRFLEIRVRASGGGGFTTLSPRQQINSGPYTIKSLNADTAANAINAANATTATTANNSLQLGGVDANQYVLTGDARLSDARNPLPGSSSYIQNQNAGPQSASNFSISGNGTIGGTLSANIVNATTQYNIGGLRVLSNPGSGNVFAGAGAGIDNTTGFNNSFFGRNAGGSNTTGGNNSFFGAGAGFANATNNNSFFGYLAGNANTTGAGNTFFGMSAGNLNTTGGANVFFGHFGGSTNTTGSNNTIVGQGADVGSGGLTFATAIGSRAFVTQSNSLVLGSISGVNNSAANTNVGIGTTAPTERLDIGVNSGKIIFGGAGCPSGSVAVGLNGPFGNCLNYSVRGDGTNLLINRPTGGEVLFRENNGSTQVRIRPGGALAISVLGTGGATALCRNASNEISTCSSSIRYKSNVNRFGSGLSLIRKLRPVSFDWLNGASDLGLVAEEAAAVEPLLTTTNEKGEVEGVKYDRVGVVAINAIKEQQMQIEAQERRNESQQKEIEALKATIKALQAFLCEANPTVSVCTGEPK